MSAPGTIRLCVVIPVYNHAAVLGRVLAGAKQHFPVIAVDDGSTDETPKVLQRESGITHIHLPQNVGKAGAMLAGFARARGMGFTHAITIDADGQHPTEALPAFAQAARENPAGLIIGVRELKAARAPFLRRMSNRLSKYWFRVQTGVPLRDTQCGYRVYPLGVLETLAVKSDRYAFETEVMVKASWAGIALVPQPVSTDYDAPTSRMSHFHPVRDFSRVFRVQGRLALIALLTSKRVRRLVALGEWSRLKWSEKILVFRRG